MNFICASEMRHLGTVQAGEETAFAPPTSLKLFKIVNQFLINFFQQKKMPSCYAWHNKYLISVYFI